MDNEEISEKLDDALETAMRVMNRLFTQDKDDKSADKLSGEIEQMDMDAQKQAQQLKRCIKNNRV